MHSLVSYVIYISIYYTSVTCQYTSTDMGTTYYLLQVLLLVLPLLFIIAKFYKSPQNSSLPCPRKLPIIGNLHQLGAHPHRSLNKLSLEYGPLMLLRLGSIPTLIISSADSLREVFKAHDFAFSSRPSLYATTKFSYGSLSIAFAPYGDFWREARKLCISEILTTKRVQSFYKIRKEEVEALVSGIRKACASSALVNMNRMMHTITNKVVSRAMFGDKIATPEHGEVLVEMQRLLGEFWVVDYLPWFGWIDALTGLRKRLRRNLKQLDEFYDHVIKEHMSGGAPEHELHDLVHVLLQLHSDPVHGKTFSSMNHIKGIITDLFVAGTDTSAATLTWAMTEIMRNPDILSKAQDEVRKVAGNKGKVEEDDLQHLTYLKLIIKETMRLHTPAPLLLPHEMLETCVIQGHTIPAKTRVLINASAISLDPGTWENPELFWPERFVDKDVDFRGQHYSLAPFGVGRRSCPGISFALSVIELVLANLLYCFDWELPAGTSKEDIDLEEEIGLTVHKKNPLLLVPKLVHV